MNSLELQKRELIRAGDIDRLHRANGKKKSSPPVPGRERKKREKSDIRGDGETAAARPPSPSAARVARFSRERPREVTKGFCGAVTRRESSPLA